ncbi:MAG TPA: ATP-dependent DNA helicase RecG [Elusimicrobiales bacterium]|nr:ATP-dependent DNA helicase RecG [Elusimicrobiales bacterium]
MQTTSIQYIKGVGPGRAKVFERLDVATVDDLLSYYPRTWHDRRLNAPVKLFEDTGVIVFFGTVTDVYHMPARRGMGIFKVQVTNDKGKNAEAIWYRKFNRFSRYDPFITLKRHIRNGAKIWVVGRAEEKFSYLNRINVEEFYMANDEDAQKVHINRIIPVYTLTEKLNPKFMRQTVYNALTKYGADYPDCLPYKFRLKRKLLNLSQSLQGIHFPESLTELESAKKRLVYEEFLFMLTAWAIKKRQTKICTKNYSYKIKKHLLTPFKHKLGFEFTASQKKVINEIIADMQSVHPMTRLLQGDVGSGKTVVALSAMLLAVENGFQCAFMAPTEILAEQHYLTFKKFLSALPIKFELLTSKVTPKSKKEILDNLHAGKIDILIGTHALLEKNVRFKTLKLVVIDEQHRFGVRQRATLRQKSQMTDLLIMTATPIPRTLSLALYSDLDVSIINELPPGRRPIKTISCDENQTFDLIRNEIKKGRQAYIVHPLIDESSKLELKSVKKEFERLEKIFPEFKMAMLHGQMKAKTKAKVMEDFLNKKIHILVATSVIEVGIDVKNASLMAVQNAERFGLASLHQLRGRIGRGEYDSTCCLIAEPKSKVAKERIEILCKTQDGFKIGEKDIELRGPGEVLGVRQHGEIELKLGDLVSDKQILDFALEDREQLLTDDSNLLKEDNQLFRQKLVNLYSKKWNLIDLA